MKDQTFYLDNQFANQSDSSTPKMAEEQSSSVDKNYGFGEFVKHNNSNKINVNPNWRRSSKEDKDALHHDDEGHGQIDDGDKHRVYSPNETPGFPR